MSKRVYISADYSVNNGDRDVVDELHKWGNDNLHKVNYVDTAEVVSGSVSNDPDCRPCELKKEFKEPLINHRYFITIDKSVRENSLSRAFSGFGFPVIRS